MSAHAPSQNNAPTGVSVVTVTYHTGPVLFDMIASVMRQMEVLEMILVDNGNPPETVEKLRRMAALEPRLRIMAGQGNVGFATGCNLGAGEAKGGYLFFLNPDCILPDESVAAFLKESAAHPRPHMISARVLDEHGVEQSGSRRAQLTPEQAFSEVFSIYRFFPDYTRLGRFKLHEEPVPDHTVPMPAVSGAVMFFPREDYFMVGGFDNGYFLHADDLDLCLRFTRAGGTIYFMPNPPVTHIGGTSEAPKLKVEYWKTKSLVRYFYKNFKGQYSSLVLAMVAAGAWLRFGFMAVKRTLTGGISA